MLSSCLHFPGFLNANTLFFFLTHPVQSNTPPAGGDMRGEALSSHTCACVCVLVEWEMTADVSKIKTCWGACCIRVPCAHLISLGLESEKASYWCGDFPKLNVASTLHGVQRPSFITPLTLCIMCACLCAGVRIIPSKLLHRWKLYFAYVLHWKVWIPPKNKSWRCLLLAVSWEV